MGFSLGLFQASIFLTYIVSCLIDRHVCFNDTQREKEDFLNIHNLARALIGIPPISWDEKLESFARKVANEPDPSCSGPTGPSPYGQSIMSAQYSAAFDVASVWFREKDYYNSTSNSCIKGQDCTHYTQMIWKNTTRIGCASGECGGGPGKWPVHVCEYDPPGNIPGQSPY